MERNRRQTNKGVNPKRIRIKREIDQSNTSFCSANEMDETQNDNDEAMADGVNEGELVKGVAQCVLAWGSKRGYVRFDDISLLFSDKKEREKRERVMKNVERLLKDVFGYSMIFDNESRRYFVSTNLQKGSQMANRLIEFDRLKNPDPDNDRGMDYNSLCRNELDPGFKAWLLESTLTFIFMSKRHTSKGAELERGINEILLREFLEKMFKEFDKEPISEKVFADLFGPAKNAEFVKKDWLMCKINRDKTTGEEERLYHWGPRAESIINKKALLAKFCEIYESQPKDWPDHAAVVGHRS